MARLAAYYQEDFHYAPIGCGPKQRKTAYVVYDEPRNNLFKSGYIDGGPRIRALATSEPSLSPVYNYSSEITEKPSKPRRQINGQPRLSIPQMGDMYEIPERSNPYAVRSLEQDEIDCGSVYSYNGSMHMHKHGKHKSKSKGKACKRLSYSDYAPEMRTVVDEITCSSPNQNPDNVYEVFPEDNQFAEHPEVIFTPPVSFRSDASRERWQQWPWNIVDTHASPALLSPPSPLDSGLSSQSITSSPSLEAEQVSVHTAQLPVVQSNGHVCSCAHRLYTEHIPMVSSPGIYDSGTSSPGAYFIPKSKKSLRMKNGHHANGNVVYVENDFDDPRRQVRYGVLGILGERSPSDIPNDQNFNSPEFAQHGESCTVRYYIDDGLPLKRHAPRHSKTHKTKRPQSIIIEESEKASSGNGSSPDQMSPDKSPEPESSASADVSNSVSNSSSVVSIKNEVKKGERRKSNKTAEKQIRELEDMYRKCNLSDHDLLERAERRDLPTAHQIRANGNCSNLTRSKSDTFYEILPSVYRNNPYEVAQRAPPLRRSGIPDRVADDMALRKYYKPVTTSSFNPVDNSVTYMLCSSHFTPTVPSGKDILFADNPDIEYDDFSYRKHYFGKKSKILDPQPPFGIPLRPPPPQSVYNDYLHVIPTREPKPLCHPRGNPDVIRDDMAFRTLRKDEAELYYEQG